MNRLPKLLTMHQAAEILHVSTRAIANWIKDGTLHAYKPDGTKLVRIAESDLLSLLVPARMDLQ